MTLKDKLNGPEFNIWIVFAVFLILSIVLLSGKGANLIAGYNTASEKDKAKFDGKKLSRVAGIGMTLITVLILIMGIFINTLPASFSYVFGGIVIADCITVIVLMCTICKKK